jgi:hypothetical protein
MFVTADECSPTHPATRTHSDREHTQGGNNEDDVSLAADIVEYLKPALVEVQRPLTASGLSTRYCFHPAFADNAIECPYLSQRKVLISLSLPPRIISSRFLHNLLFSQARTQRLLKHRLVNRQLPARLISTKR